MTTHDDDLDARLRALRADPPASDFGAKLRASLASVAEPSAETARVVAIRTTDVELDARLRSLRVAPPSTDFDARLRAELELAARRRPYAMTRFSPWLARVAVALLATLAPVVVYAAGLRIVRALRHEQPAIPAAPIPAAPAPIAPTPRPARHVHRAPASTPTFEAPAVRQAPPVVRIAPSRDHESGSWRPARTVPSAQLEPPAATNVEATPPAAPTSAVEPPSAPRIERLRVDLGAHHREAELRPPPHEAPPPPQGAPSAGSAPGSHHPPAGGPHPPLPPGGVRPPDDGRRPLHAPDGRLLPPGERMPPPPPDRLGPPPPPDRPPPPFLPPRGP